MNKVLQGDCLELMKTMYDWYVRRGYEYYQEYEHAKDNVWIKKKLN